MALSDEEILTALPLILTGAAYETYRLEHANWRTFADFRDALRAWFGDATLDDRLQAQALTHTQGEGEPVAIYIARLRGLLRRMSAPWTLSAEINLILHNMRPEIREGIYTRDCQTHRDLLLAATERERILARSRAFPAPPKPNESYIPELAELAYTGKPSGSPRESPVVAVLDEPRRNVAATSSEDLLEKHIKPLQKTVSDPG